MRYLWRLLIGLVVLGVGAVIVLASASYPSGTKSFSTKVDGPGQTIFAAHINEIQDEIVAVENALLTGLAHTLLPDTNNTRDLGSNAKRWANGHFQVLKVAGASVSPLTRTAKTANYSAICSDLVDASSGTWTITMPLAASNVDCVIAGVNNGTGTITVARSGSDTIGLATSQTLNGGTASTQGDSQMWHSDGVSNWIIQ